MLNHREKQAYLSFLDETGLSTNFDDDDPTIFERIKYLFGKYLKGSSYIENILPD